MKVIYKDDIMKQIQRAVYDADVASKRIDRIELTVDEANRISDEIRRTMHVPELGYFKRYYSEHSGGAYVGKFYGVDLFVEPTP
jgi:hypothetical protein